MVAKANQRTQRAHTKGITLLECLITVLILTLTATLSIPSFTNLSAKQTVQQITTALQGSFARMKILAINRGSEIVLCGTVDKSQCVKDWSQGFMSFEDTNHNRERDRNESILEYHTPLKNTHGFHIQSCSRRYFRTSEAGPLASIAGRIVIQPPVAQAHLTQHLVISRIGRTRRESQPNGQGC